MAWQTFGQTNFLVRQTIWRIKSLKLLLLNNIWKDFDFKKIYYFEQKSTTDCICQMYFFKQNMFKANQSFLISCYFEFIFNKLCRFLISFDWALFCFFV